MRYLKYIGIVLLDATLYLLGFFLFPIAYIIRPESGFLWWFLNDENMYGYEHQKYWKHYGKENFFVAYVWNVIRNSHWNARTLVFMPLLGKAVNVNIITNIIAFEIPKNKTEEQLAMEFRDFDNPGKQFAEYSKSGRDYFRWSECKEVTYLWVFKRTRSMMFGWSNSRPVFKIRHRKPII